MRIHTGKRLRGRIARHKKVSIVVGSATGLIAAGGIAFGIAILGGQVTGSISSNGAEPNATWVGTPTFNNCVDGSGATDTTATGSVTLSGGQVVISLSNVYAGEVCQFTGVADDLSQTAVDVTGVNLTATDTTNTGNPQVAVTSTLPNGAISLTADPGGSDPAVVAFQVTVPAALVPGDSYTISGGLVTSLPSTGGWNRVTNTGM